MGPGIHTSKYYSSFHYEYNTQSWFLRTLTSWITVFSYSAACDWALSEMAVNNVMPLYPQQRFQDPIHTPVATWGKQCWMERHRAQVSCCFSVAHEPLTLAKPFSSRWTLFLIKQNNVWTKPEKHYEAFQFLTQLNKHLQSLYDVAIPVLDSSQLYNLFFIPLKTRVR